MPIEDDARAWAGITAELSPADAVLFDRVLAAVTGEIESLYSLPDPPSAGELAAWEQAIVMQTGRIWKRKDTPEGLVSFDGAGVIRVGSFDADVDRLLARFPTSRWNVG